MRRGLGLFAAAALAACAVKPVAPARQAFQALGTEPFWSISVTPEALMLTTPESPVARRISYRLSRQGKALLYEGVLDSQATTLLIEPGQCSDGMSDTVYAYRATWSVGRELQRGCARLI